MVAGRQRSDEDILNELQAVLVAAKIGLEALSKLLIPEEDEDGTEAVAKK